MDALIRNWFEKRRYEQNVRAAINHLSADTELATTIFRSLPKLNELLSKFRAEGETPEYCATMLLGQIYPKLLIEGVSDQELKLIARQIGEYQTTGRIQTESPRFITLKYQWINMTLEGWTREGKIDSATALYLRVELIGTIGGLDAKHRAEHLRKTMEPEAG